MFAKQLAADVLQHIRHLHHDHQIGDQEQVSTFIAGNVQGQQGGHVRDTEHRDHQAPLDFGSTLQKVRAVAAQGGEDR
ncbi:hypothetical protein D3C71_2045440 [compost metagenome]